MASIGDGTLGGINPADNSGSGSLYDPTFGDTGQYQAPGGSPTSTPSGGSGFNLGQIGNQVAGAIGMTPQQIAALGGAYQMYNNAGQFQTQSQQDATLLDPFGSQQPQYQKQLANLEADPSSIANTPGYQFALQQGLGATNRGDMASKGAVPDSDDISFASGLAQQTYNSQIAQLTQLSGANFSPQSAAGILQTGMTGSIGAQTAAMNDIFAGAFQPQGSTVNNNYGPGGGSTGGGVNPPPGTFGNPPINVGSGSTGGSGLPPVNIPGFGGSTMPGITDPGTGVVSPITDPNQPIPPINGDPNQPFAPQQPFAPNPGDFYLNGGSTSYDPSQGGGFDLGSFYS